MKQRIITALILAPLVILGIFKLSLPLFMIAIAAVTLIGFWEWTQFVDAPSRMIALIPTVLVSAATIWLVPSDALSLNLITQPHYIILALGCIWWLAASALAVTYPKSSSLWQNSNLLRYSFGILTLLPFFLERTHVTCRSD